EGILCLTAVRLTFLTSGICLFSIFGAFLKTINMLDQLKIAAVIGSGTMGNGICHVFAQSGYRVHMMDVNQSALDKAIATIGKNMDRQIAKNTMTEAAKAEALSRISTFTSLPDA